MTSEEAEAINRAEYEADCRAARERAYQLVAERRAETKAQLAALSLTEEPKPKPKPKPKPRPRPKAERKRSGRKPILVSANGMTMTYEKWAEHLGISKGLLYRRVHKTGSFEAAVALGGPRRKRKGPGVVLNLEATPRDRRGSTTQDSAEIGISH